MGYMGPWWLKLYNNHKKDIDENNNAIAPPILALTKNQITEDHIEDCCQRSADIIEGDIHILEAQVVKCDHAHKYEGQWQNLKWNHKQIEKEWSKDSQ